MSAVLAESAPALPSRVELRQYTLHAGRRDELVALFERELVAAQEACGVQVLGSFRDVDDPCRFTWLRAFPDDQARTASLQRFYGGAHWRAHREAANATMRAWDDARLLEPFALPAPRRQGAGIVTITLYPLPRDGTARFRAFFERALVPLLWNASVAVDAAFATAPVENGYPALPVRDDTVFAWAGRHASLARAEQDAARIEEALDWTPRVADELAALTTGAPRTLRLQPTARSRWRG